MNNSMRRTEQYALDGEVKSAPPSETRNKESMAGAVVRDMVRFEPVREKAPRVPANFGEMSRWERSVESVPFLYGQILYTLSPQGILRAWIKMCARMMGYLVPCIIVLFLAVKAAVLALTVALYIGGTLVALMACKAMCRALAEQNRKYKREEQ